MCQCHAAHARRSTETELGALQVEELRELQSEWSQEYKVRRQMLIERAKVRMRLAFWHQETCLSAGNCGIFAGS